MFKNKEKILINILIIFLGLTIFGWQGNVYALDYRDYYSSGNSLYDKGEYKQAQVEFEKARKALREQGDFIPLEKPKDSQERELQNSQKDNKSLEQEIGKIKKEKLSLERDLEKINKKLKKKNKPVAGLNKKIKKLESAVIEREKLLITVQGHVSKINKEKGNLSRELAALKEELIKLYQRRGEPKKTSADRSFVEKKFSSFKNILGSKKEEKEKQSYSIRDKLEHYEQLKKENKGLHDDLVMLRRQSNYANKKNKNLLQELASFKDNLMLRTCFVIRIIFEEGRLDTELVKTTGNGTVGFAEYQIVP